MESYHLEDAEASLVASINQSQNPSHHVLASRALVRTRLQGWDAALLDAGMVFFTLFARTLTLTLLYTKALQIEPSLIAYIAKSLAHVGNGERDIGPAASHSNASILLTLLSSFSSRSALLYWASLFCSHLLGPLSCLWRESASMQSHGWTTLLLLSGTTQSVMWSRCVHSVLLRVEYYRRRF